VDLTDLCVLKMSCQLCSELHAKVRKAQTVSGSGSHPTTLELAYMVNLEYYVDMLHNCVHKVPESKKAKIKINDMVKFLDERHWQLGTRTNYNGKIKLLQCLYFTVTF
jgi:hypothetical protein